MALLLPGSSPKAKCTDSTEDTKADWTCQVSWAGKGVPRKRQRLGRADGLRETKGVEILAEESRSTH